MSVRARPGVVGLVRYTALPGDGPCVRDILERAGADPAAVADGRVFVGRRRVRTPDEPVREGDVVEIASPQQPAARPAIVLRTDDLVAANKPAGVPTIADHAGAAHALLALVARELGVDSTRLHPTSRLDRDVSGVVVFALSKAAASRLARARAVGSYERRYLALAASAPASRAGTWDAPIGRAGDPRLRVVNGRDAAPARTCYAVCATAASGAAMLALSPVTGRTHQLRVHASHAGAPLVGDRAYGGPVRLTMAGGRVVEPRRIALHAARVVVPDEHSTPRAIEAPVPPELETLWTELGGASSAWEVCANCALARP